MEPWQWAQSFDKGFRYGQMTTNLVEGINAAGYLDAKNGLATSRPDGGETRVCRTCQGCNGCKPSDGEVNECRNIFTMTENVSSY
ncbi:hypothetical protein GOBAR_DD26900 [Gossypium barbadense]|nr:hypothetical protein GOBAR_DD26900 [Gossypium barbadense]